MRNSIECRMSKITEIIKTLRTAPFGFSQMEIERRTGISQSRISRWENGDVAAGADDALKLVSLYESLRNPATEKATSQAQQAQPATEAVAGVA